MDGKEKERCQDETAREDICLLTSCRVSVERAYEGSMTCSSGEMLDNHDCSTKNASYNFGG